ncbi:MAG: hypothetical protein SFT94_04410 [Pseudanabaenaceae cyanobacterium bins.68]|nr:hypothetical protein [Pseudanabaenaceae cyanobacterium bins.68]
MVFKPNLSLVLVFLNLNFAMVAQAQSPLEPADLPEEVLRLEIYTEARSPLDGRPLSAKAYAELQEELGELDGGTAAFLVSPRLKDLIELLKLRRTLRQVIPFIP